MCIVYVCVHLNVRVCLATYRYMGVHVETRSGAFIIYIFGEIPGLGKLSESVCSQKKLCKLLHREMAVSWVVSLFLCVRIKVQITESALTVGFYLISRLETCK